MSKSMQEVGQQLIREGESILRRDVQGALTAEDYNLVVRRAQEVVELVLKGALKVLGIDYPKVHDVAPVFSEQVRKKRDEVDEKALRRVEDISFWLTQARAPSFYLERDYSEEDAEHAFQDATFVLKEIERILDIENKS